MSQSPLTSRIASSDEDYVEAWRQVNELLRHGRSFSGRERHRLFLNLHGERFANASAVSGFDWIDDGRSLAVTDWDQDGDLDVWLVNRNSPRVRFLQNRFSDHPETLSVILVGNGTSVNRDAIGARVEVEAQGDRQVRTVHCGAGYLSQSSRWLCFGHSGDRITNIRVRWPDGEVEAFSPPTAANRIRLVQGAGRIEELRFESRQVDTGQSVAHKAATQQTQNLLSARLPMPPMVVTGSDGRSLDFAQGGPKPKFVSLWSTTCQLCLREMLGWTSQRQTMEDQVDVVLLSVDAIDVASGSSDADVSKFLQKAGIPFANSMASEALLQKLQIVHDQLYDHHRPLPIPTSFLIDRSGALAAIYKGPVSVDRLLTDVKRLSLRGKELLAAATPFEGTWIGLPGPHQLSKISDALVSEGLTDDAIRFANRLDSAGDGQNHAARVHVKRGVELAKAGNVQEAYVEYQAALKLDPTSSRALFELGTLLGRQSKYPLAIQYLRKSIEHASDPNPDAHLNLAVALRRSGKTDTARQELVRALEIDPRLAPAHATLALLHGQQGRMSDAMRHFRSAVDLEPGNVQYRINLAVALIQRKQFTSALQQLKTALLRDPDSLPAIRYTAELLRTMDRPQEAKALVEGALARNPNSKPLREMLASLRNDS